MQENKKRRKVAFLYIMPTLNMIVFNTILHSSIPSKGTSWAVVVVGFMAVHVVVTIIMPSGVRRIEKCFRMKEMVCVIGSVLFANFVLIIPEVMVSIQSDDFYSFDEDSVYLTIIGVSLIPSLVSTFYVFFTECKKTG